MADFCRQCSLQLFGEDFKDLAGLVTEEQFKEKHLVSLVICEGCGYTEVNHLGECMIDDCLEKGHPGYVGEEDER